MASKNQGKFEVFEGLPRPTGRTDKESHTVYVRRFFFRLKSGNGKIICQSEGYNSRAACMKGIAAIKRLAADAPVVEV